MQRKYTRRPVADRFWEKVDQRGPDECWPWLGGRNPKGYGYFNRGQSRIAHRVAYELTYGVCVLPSWQVCHRCDNPPCCNPAHLFPGLPVHNTRDMLDKGRNRNGIQQGERNGMAKLTEADVRAIRSRYAAGSIAQMALAREYGVHQTVVSDIIKRLIWSHVS